MVSGD